MRKFLLAMGVILICSAPGLAQGVAPATPNLSVASEAEVVTPKVEVFAGYSYLRQYGENYNGGVGAVTVNVNRWFGLTGDFSGYAPVDADDATGFAVGGPRFTYRRGPVTPFMHIMGGAAFGGGDAAGALIVGGGVDAKVSEHVAIRIFSADYIATTFRSNNGRISAGIVFRFGERH
jgi:hypothetical protein